uniref:CRAL-TRIO domain-containing protein n=1 Tax=Trieres chinensis TaxID=1514140 RepID=A0A7S2ACK5_TRICV|mmetsp:Transcript_9963/g.21060  ORF Transcript_9963/g.21060 Transcript_9963/m.21060 type:complete len:303 (+) Transcript_9963:40-948(+)|eukprot:CAMPEP_0183311900 /NCGR_PEP_ID=MMETSP0160_2-20130417/39436_1 /TAXON_ID=2839 ORGANISM="Odontella Sinensis, Strain Grunow 1884" /NCGR_SAMPLE_ID=MMETSP0160_2 /ASSEMBLY_ACC=CAM_ASM_000250 /LENGTH=302 /DNA_ID=CAMNT_0025476639 /DNA_START=36 /DNA_END=944 /DNA_ORIENTATION=+
MTNPVIKKDDSVDEKSRSMLACLSVDELETAARSSYQYFVSSASGERPSDMVRDRHATSMAQRYLFVNFGDEKKALEMMRHTLQYRKDIGVDDIRRCFDDLDSKNEEKHELYNGIRDKLKDQFATGYTFVRGYDRKGRALYPVIPRHHPDWDREWYMKMSIYNMERALACTERKSGGAEQKILVLYDYNGYSNAHRPPISLVKDLLSCLRDHYPQCLYHAYVIDAPAIFRVFYNLIKVFIDPITKSTVQFVTGDEEKKNILGDLLDEDEAMPYMLPGGKKASDVDIQKYLYEVPFDHDCDAE